MLGSNQILVRLALFGLTASCAPKVEPDAAANASTPHFLTFGPGVNGLISEVKRPEIRACLSGIGASQRAVWEQNIRSVILKWVEPLRSLTSDPLTNSVAIVDSNADCEVVVIGSPGTWSNTTVTDYPTVRMDVQGYFASYNVLLHEFGHAFALSDTYMNGQSGNCMPGQPQAVMCNTKFAAPQADDVAGVQKIFKRVFPKDVPGAVPVATGKIFMALGTEAGAAGAYAVHFAYEKMSTVGGGLLSYCKGSQPTCIANGSWLDTDKVNNGINGVEKFKAKLDMVPEVDGVITIRYAAGATLAYQSVKLIKKNPLLSVVP